MKGMKPSELRDKNIEDLAEELAKEREALYNVRRQIIFGQVKDVMSVRGHRKNIAKLMTVITQKQREDAQ
jgi:large subunit ribosomal protein L29